MIDRINEFRKSKKTTKPKTSRRKKSETVDLKEFNSFNEDLRLSNSSKSASKASSKASPESAQEVDLNAEERTRLVSPNSPPSQTDENKIKEYASQISKMASMLNFSKLKTPRKPRQTLKSRKNAGKKGTSLNGPTTKPKASRRKKTQQNDISL
jgi:hypothetical protein